MCYKLRRTMKPINFDSSYLIVENLRGTAIKWVVELVHDVGNKDSWFHAVRETRDKFELKYPSDRYRIEVFFPSDISALPFASSALRLAPRETIYQSTIGYH